MWTSCFLGRRLDRRGFGSMIDAADPVFGVEMPLAVCRDEFLPLLQLSV